MTDDRDRELCTDNHNFHNVWCDQRPRNESHDDNLPYCYRQVHGVTLHAAQGDEFPPNMWVYVIGTAHPDVLTSGECPEGDEVSDGLEMVTEHRVGDEWVERKFRLSSDAARSLAAALIRAADIQQGLTR